MNNFQYITETDVPCYACLCLAACKHQDIFPTLLMKCSILSNFYKEASIDKCFYNWLVTRNVIRGTNYEWQAS